MADPSFTDIGRRGTIGARSACPICGQRNAGSVQIQVLSATTGRKPKSVVTVSKRLCERHAVELYQALDEVWNRFLERSSSS